MTYESFDHAVEKYAPDAPWVRWGLERRVTPWGFKPDGTPYTLEEYREDTGETELEMLQPVMNYQEGLSVSEALQQVPNALPSMLEVPILNAISDGVHDRSLRFRSHGLMSINRNGEPIVIGDPTDNGYVYRNPGAFEDRGDDVAYIANAAWEEPMDTDEQGYVKLSDIDPEHVYTYGRILADCQGSRAMAERIFAQLDWQHPAALYEEEMQLLAEDWEAAPKTDYMIRQSENVRLYIECKLREPGHLGLRAYPCNGYDASRRPSGSGGVSCRRRENLRRGNGALEQDRAALGDLRGTSAGGTFGGCR